MGKRETREKAIQGKSNSAAKERKEFLKKWRVENAECRVFNRSKRRERRNDLAAKRRKGKR